jgi:hypothetical protein
MRMKVRLLPVIAAILTATISAIAAGAGTGGEQCDSIDLSSFPTELPNRVELLEAVAELLKAHCRCEFPLAVRDHLTVDWDPRFDTVDEIFANSPECFGELRVHNVKVFDEAWIGHVMLEPRSSDVAVRYVAVEFSFQLVDGTWVHTWPKGIEHWESDCE